MAKTVHNLGWHRSRPGFTLVELLLVIAIIGILMTILIPTLGNVQRSARKSKSTNNLHQIGGAFGAYANDHDNLLPAPTFGSTSAPANAVGSSNPRGATWLEEIVYPYLDGSIQASTDGSKVVVTKWPEVLTDPEFYMANDDTIPEPDSRGYGMNIFPYLADRSGTEKKRTQPFRIERQKLSLLPNLSNNIIVGTSDGPTREPGADGRFSKAGMNQYPTGNPVRFNGEGLYLFMDWSVQSLRPDEVAKILSSSNTNP